MLSCELVQGVSPKNNKAYYGIKVVYDYTVFGEKVERSFVEFIDKERYLLIKEQLKKEGNLKNE